MPRQNTQPADYPQAVVRQIQQLARNIVVARRRRGETQAQWARKLGVSQPTMARIERGDPAVAMASYVMCLWLVNQAEGLAELIAPQHDQAALEQEVGRVRPARKAPAARTPAGAAASDRPRAPVPPAPVPSTAQEASAPPVAVVREEASPWATPGQGRPHAAAAGLAALMRKTSDRAT
jgi:DNA-binding XRE family transcriptional regulator